MKRAIETPARRCGAALLALVALSAGCRTTRSSAGLERASGTGGGGEDGTSAAAPSHAAWLGTAAPAGLAGQADAGGAPDAGLALTAPETPPPAPPPKVKVYLRASPRAAVSWGRKSLGLTPIALERPRDSGPIDLVFRAQGYLPLHTRAYTFRSDSIYVQLTRIENAANLLGAKKAPPPVPGSPDGGVTSSSATAATPDGGVTSSR